MADNISVKITADVVDLQAQFSVAKAESAALTLELNKLARQAAQTGLTDQLKAQLDAAAEAMLLAKATSATLAASPKSELAEAASVSSMALEKVSSAAEVLIAHLGAGKLFEMGKYALESAANIQHEADVLQLSTTAYQAYSEFAKVAHVATDTFDTAVLKFIDNLGKAEQGSKAQADALQQLGVSAHAPADVALPLVAQGVLKISDTSARAALEVALFGKSGEELNPVLEVLAQGSDTLAAKLKAMGLMLGPEITEAAHEAESKLEVAFDRFRVSYTPAVIVLTNALSDLLESMQGVDDKSGLFFGPGGVVNLAGGSTTTVPTELEGTEAKAKKEQDEAVAAQQSNAVPKQIPEPEIQAPDIAGAEEAYRQGEEAARKAAEEAKRAAEEERRLTDEQARGAEQLALKRNEAAQQANNFELQMGDESLEKWKANAIEESNAKLKAELDYLNKKAAADKGNVVEEQKDLDQINLLQQDHVNALATIDRQYAEKKRAMDQQALQNKIRDDNTEYSETVSKLNTEVADHQISATKRAQAEIALATTVERQELAMFDAAHIGANGVVTLTAQETKQRQAIIDTFNKRVETANDQLVREEAQKWTTLGNSIKSSFNSAIDGMLFQGKSFEQGMLAIAQGVLKAFISMGEDIAEQWIESQIKSLFTTEATQESAAAVQVQTQAGIAAATAYAQWAAFPPVADAMAGETYAETLMWGLPKFATGAWDLKSDTLAQLHKGEMVVPQNFAEGMRAGRGLGSGGGDVNMHYGPTINAREAATLSQMLSRESGEMLAWLNRQFRNGALRV